MRHILNVLFFILCSVDFAYSAPRFLTISDIHYGAENTAADGHDTGPGFLNTALGRIKELSKHVDFILYLGDLPTHSLFDAAKKEEFERVLFHGLYDADHSLKPMFYITGNNDSLTGNYQPFEIDGKSPLSAAADWNGACIHCDGLLIENSHMRHDGYYSAYVIPNNKDIMLFALNTVQWTKIPFYMPQYPNQQKDAYTQLFWLEQQLKSHRAKQLLIAMHVPPGTSYKGTSFWHDAYLKKFIQLLEQYHHRYGQITLLASHTHMDEFRKIHLADGTDIYDYSTPGVSRVHHNNPGVKVFTLDKNMKIKNFATYYTTSLTSWGTEQYQAIDHDDAIFPACHNVDLAQCLSTYSEEQVCAAMDKGLFYGVKSPRIRNQECLKTYWVNSR